MCFSWTAEVLAWDPSKYNGLSNITIFTSEAWRPDIEIFNHVDFYDQSLSPTIMLLQANGSVEWCPQIKATVSCDTDMSHFPHDSHTCVLLVGSSTYTYEELKLEPRLIRDSTKQSASSNWQVTQIWFTLDKGRETEDYYDYALQFVIRASRRFSLHRYSFTLPLFTCAILTFMFCWTPLTNEKRFHLGLVSVVLNMYLMIRYSDTLRHSTSTPWGLRFAGDLMLFTCCMITLQILCLALEEVLVPFAAYPVVERLLSTTFVSSYVLNERLVLINEEELDSDAEIDDADVVAPVEANGGDSSKEAGDEPASTSEKSSGKVAEENNRLQPESQLVEETVQMTSVNESWRKLLVVSMRISVTVFLTGYAMTYYALDLYEGF